MKYILNILFITIFTLTSFAQESDHEVGVWQFRTVDESDVENFLYNEDNVYRKLAAEAIKGGKLVHWALLRKVNGYLHDDSPNYFFYNGFKDLENLDDPTIWGSGSVDGLKPVESVNLYGAVHSTSEVQVFPDVPKPGNYVVINYANPSNVLEFVNLQNEVWKPFITKYINDDNSTSSGWEVHRVLSPTGNGYNWTVATVDHYTTLSGALNPFPEGAEWPEGLDQINDLMPNGKFYKTVIYEVLYYEGPNASK
tara:strand:+ start:338 stop:1096 length:759 start_codon:yes stop_codon:yes gene_type:complete